MLRVMTITYTFSNAGVPESSRIHLQLNPGCKEFYGNQQLRCTPERALPDKE
jgi:hypothetical protein